MVALVVHSGDSSSRAVAWAVNPGVWLFCRRKGNRPSLRTALHRRATDRTIGEPPPWRTRGDVALLTHLPARFRGPRPAKGVHCTAFRALGGPRLPEIAQPAQSFLGMRRLHSARSERVHVSPTLCTHASDIAVAPEGRPSRDRTWCPGFRNWRREEATAG